MNLDKNDASTETTIAIRRWDGNDGWGGIWGRTRPLERRIAIAIGLVWVVAMVVGGFIVFG